MSFVCGAGVAGVGVGDKARARACDCALTDAPLVAPELSFSVTPKASGHFGHNFNLF